MGGGGLVSNGCPSLTNRGHDGASNDGPSPATGVRDVACGGGMPHVNAALSGEPTEQRGQPAKRMVAVWGALAHRRQSQFIRTGRPGP